MTTAGTSGRLSSLAVVPDNVKKAFGCCGDVCQNRVHGFVRYFPSPVGWIHLERCYFRCRDPFLYLMICPNKRRRLIFPGFKQQLSDVKSSPVTSSLVSGISQIARQGKLEFPTELHASVLTPSPPPAYLSNLPQLSSFPQISFQCGHQTPQTS